MMQGTAGPNRVLPIIFLVTFCVGFGVNYGVPWIGTGSDTATESTWLWAHELRADRTDPDNQGFLADHERSPANWTLVGLIMGASLSILWVVLSFALPARFFTPGREAAVAALLGLPLFFTAIGGAMGLGYSFAMGDGRTVWAVSIAGMVVTAMAILGAVGLLLFLRNRLPGRTAPVYVLAGTILAVTAFHALPWTSTIPDDIDGRAPEAQPSMTNTYREGFASAEAAPRSTTDDPLDVLGAALLITAIGATVWILVAGILPPLPRATPYIDAGFALLALVPMILATMGVGRFFGSGLDMLFSSGDDAWGLSWNGILFTGLLVGMAIVTLRTFSRSLNDAGVSA